ncbi:MAG: MarR family winged helix-turn-helix transcriptional regulator [Candidatus Heteroscillospira sp.]
MQRFETFVGSVTELYRLIQRIKNLEMSRLGLSGRHVMCLNYLKKHPDGLTAGELCALCGEDKAAVSRTLSELRERELVQGGAGYRAPIRLTGGGMRLAETVGSISDEVVEAGGAGLTDGQREDLYRSMDIICENLRRYCAHKEDI